MQSKEFDFVASLSYDKEIERAKWFKNDLEKGGWKEVHKSPGKIYWSKTFPEEEVPIKVLSLYDMPLSAKMFMDLFESEHLDKRNKWDQVFVDHETVETYPDQGVVRFMRYPSSFPLWDRSFVLYYPPTKEIDWFGKRAFIKIQKNAWHPSKPEGADGLVRATNGGNFTVIIPDETNPDAACTLFNLSNNNLNGWLPKKNIEWLIGGKAAASFNVFYGTMIEGLQKILSTKLMLL
ncbi:hypothetical protein OS493_039371 [Desmophyllum pertusum]|uniref:START domain-containing protein n=1 Tax=Desmophyllum pertusum TaxID=174260 RepID=A0A9W9YTX7_9CNID|nr:hypothetical protein OS493_039371 [Desmophyllum pertusum]